MTNTGLGGRGGVHGLVLKGAKHAWAPPEIAALPVVRLTFAPRRAPPLPHPDEPVTPPDPEE